MIADLSRASRSNGVCSTDIAVADPHESFCFGIILGLASGDVRAEAAHG